MPAFLSLLIDRSRKHLFLGKKEEWQDLLVLLFSRWPMKVEEDKRTLLFSVGSANVRD